MRSPGNPADGLPPTLLGELARRRDVVDGTLTCGKIERVLASHSRWGSVVIRRTNGGLTILDRDRFMGQMAGQLGYGRALYDRQPVERLTGDAPVLALGERTALDAAAAAVLGRAETYRYDDLLVMLDDGGVATLVVADLFAALSEIHGHSALHDPLTGLANRQLLLDRLRHARAQLVRRGGHVAVVSAAAADRQPEDRSRVHRRHRHGPARAQVARPRARGIREQPAHRHARLSLGWSASRGGGGSCDGQQRPPLSRRSDAPLSGASDRPAA